jgi:crotonobetainyl-CoA:carnitine CoA-transferase CaiB-like acyl-CoA transferase
VSLLASSLALLPDPSAHYFASGVAPQRVGNRNPNVTPAEAFRAADGFVNVVILEPRPVREVLQPPRLQGAGGDGARQATGDRDGDVDRLIALGTVAE